MRGHQTQDYYNTCGGERLSWLTALFDSLSHRARPTSQYDVHDVHVIIIIYSYLSRDIPTDLSVFFYVYPYYVKYFSILVLFFFFFSFFLNFLAATLVRHVPGLPDRPLRPRSSASGAACRLTGFPSLLFILTLLHGLVVLAPTTIKKGVQTSRFQV